MSRRRLARLHGRLGSGYRPLSGAETACVDQGWHRSKGSEPRGKLASGVGTWRPVTHWVWPRRPGRWLPGPVWAGRPEPWNTASSTCGGDETSRAWAAARCCFRTARLSQWDKREGFGVSRSTGRGRRGTGGRQRRASSSGCYTVSRGGQCWATLQETADRSGRWAGGDALQSRWRRAPLGLMVGGR